MPDGALCNAADIILKQAHANRHPESLLPFGQIFGKIGQFIS